MEGRVCLKAIYDCSIYKFQKVPKTPFCLIIIENLKTYAKKCIECKTRVHFFFKIVVGNIFHLDIYLAIYARNTCSITSKFSGK